MQKRPQRLPDQGGNNKADNTFLLSQLGGPFANLGPNARGLDSSQMQMAGRPAFGGDVSNILGLSDHIDKSGIIPNAELSKFFAQANDKSMSMLFKQ